MEAKRTYRSKNVVKAVEEVTRDYIKIYGMNITRMEDDSFKVFVEGKLNVDDHTSNDVDMCDSGSGSHAK